MSVNPRFLMDARPSEECDRPEELWRVGTLEVVIHLEPDGEGHIFIDAGDWEMDLSVQTTGIADLRERAFSVIDALPTDGSSA